ncbi:acyltransferase [Phenylobacterium sp.]|jgi:peptidoglycan/LPS O-acetylase OafA/YrhL|uniref:acyltransferase family protein n=1 Tax=Phenylobacterium sp. TaxID=1871053 RepID=UPI002E2F9294|nr:acyltransferase [Phenylobacterium sp.]HEX2559893.1 acyltransferase [Phenylobacterium sp.]
MTDAAHIRSLTALRFFAAFWVVMFHYWPKLDAPATPMLVQKGYLGVEAFFVLSGFILCHVYRTDVEEQRFQYGRFLWARLARVYPLHLATLFGLGGLAAAAGFAGFAVDANILSWEALPANLLMVHAWGLAPVAGWNHPSWSISAEWFAYLTFPLFAWGALALKSRPLLAVGLAAGGLAALYAGFEQIAGFPLTQATIHWGALRIVPCFALGCALHSLWRARPFADRASALLGAAFSGAAALIASAAGGPDAVIVLGLGGLIYFLAGAAQAGSQLFGHPVLVYLGEISYSVYMICVPWKIVFVNSATRVLELSGEQLPWPVWIVFALTIIPLAALSYHLIEKPARAAMKSWGDALDARRPSAARA